MNNISLKDYGDQEEVRRVNTPLSLEACYREGIDPAELLYFPLDKFARPNINLSIQKLNYDFYESQRKKLLKIVRDRYISLATDHKKVKSSKSLELNKVLSNEIQKLTESKLKYISRFANFKLNELKTAAEGEKFSVDTKAQTTTSLKFGKFSSTSKDFRPFNSEMISSPRPNRERDARLIEEERKKQQKLEENEKLKVQDAERRRKTAEMKLQEHLRRVKEIRERENQEKSQKLQKRSELIQNKLLKLQQRRNNNKQEKFLSSKERISKAKSLKSLHEDTIKQESENFLKQKTEKINQHISNKHKTQQELLEKIRDKNSKHDFKSKRSQERILNKIEEKKERTLRDFAKIQNKVKYLKVEQEKYQETLRQKNKLREVERNWNQIRANRKQDFYRNEVLNEIRTNELRVQNIQSARKFMQQFRYDINVKTQASRAKIEQELYNMEVKKRYDAKKINAIIKEEVSDELRFYHTQ